MARTTASAVTEVLGEPEERGDYHGSRSLTTFIDTANVIVNRVATCASERGITLSTTELEMMERWLAAHFYCQSDKPLGAKNDLGGGGTFHGRTDMGLDSTLYGQTAKRLDWSGCLASLDRQQRVGGFWLGKPPSEQIDYEDRD